MKDAAVIILSIYALLNALIVWYFFVYKQNKIEAQYRKRLTRVLR